MRFDLLGLFKDAHAEVMADATPPPAGETAQDKRIRVMNGSLAKVLRKFATKTSTELDGAHKRMSGLDDADVSLMALIGELEERITQLEARLP